MTVADLVLPWCIFGNDLYCHVQSVFAYQKGVAVQHDEAATHQLQKASAGFDELTRYGSVETQMTRGPSFLVRA